ncbi:MAG TPA: NAD(P)/FAD-dependent oxidoreductase [Microthrixaceae bacterium]|nr:NAD(P)/FAD-dependent oxidoreductase [Microthrixaceae bacterium]HNH95966.1 NAD(P)/FAD-dependent oxidoreductase [Microthrixaceae bacterium]HNL50186.1 NAD(P)/FAD-dependent oxidoreductase [Microthrixaceae bacterium]HPG15755.1 NAD(P)/FAD-dependent oxidoreductase [Microthrixaceae bacterium]HRW41390.1 NAD(P)/FAD-dependent oxidoreductase [Microthrixaceae bacterium]
MTSRTYDAVVIGAGHNGLCLAAYLQRAGLSTAIIERRHEEGGGVNTEEPVLSGYRHNMHAQFMEFFDVMPMIQDFGLEDLGLRTVMPEAQAGIAFADGRPPVILHRPDLLDRTHASIARYSRSDADTFVELKQRAARFEELLAVGLYNPPGSTAAVGMGTLEGRAAILEGTFGDLGVTGHFALKTPKMVIDEMFETPELRALMYRVSVEWGLPIDTAVTGTDFLTFLMWTTANWKLVMGGTHGLAKAMTQACYREGVDLIENAHVDRILVEDGRAVGVVARGVEYRAEKLVASNADVHQTLIGLVGEEHLSPLWAKRAKDFRFGPSHVLATPMFCLYEAPAYRSARWDPEIDKCFYTVVGYDGPDDMARYIRDAYSGLLPAPAAGTWVNSLWDRSQAPPGRHAATGWYFFPVASELSTEEWEEVRTTFNDRFLARWREFAPNMTADNVIAHKLYTPDQMERKNMMREGDFSHGEFVPDQQGVNRPFPEASNYRTEIEGLYLCGSSAYPGGGVHAACGYNAYKKIAEDFGLPSPIGSGRSY